MNDPNADPNSTRTVLNFHLHLTCTFVNFLNCVCVLRKKFCSCLSFLCLRVMQKALRLPVLLFLSLFPSLHCFWTTCQKLFLPMFYLFLSTKRMTKMRFTLLNTLKKMRKFFFLSSYSWHVRHMTNHVL